MPPLLDREGPLGFDGPDGFDGLEPPDELGLAPELPLLELDPPPDVLGLLSALLFPPVLLLEVDEPLLPELPLPPFVAELPPDLLVTAPPPPVQLLWPEQVEPFEAPVDDEPLPGPEELPPVQLFWPEHEPAAAWYAGEPPESVRGLGAVLAGLMSFRACGLG
ncbi:MAG TPA: hypothetical protein VFD32_11660 [Dehalococcoidia bacterium]|nr:hypothetical protein [Dehalococcoidia bacterium]